MCLLKVFQKSINRDKSKYPDKIVGTGVTPFSAKEKLQNYFPVRGGGGYPPIRLGENSSRKQVFLVQKLYF